MFSTSFDDLESQEEGKDQESIQSSTTPDPGYRKGKRQKREYLNDKQRHAMAGLSLCWSHIPHCWKAHVTARLYYLMVSGS